MVEVNLDASGNGYVYFEALGRTHRMIVEGFVVVDGIISFQASKDDPGRTLDDLYAAAEIRAREELQKRFGAIPKAKLKRPKTANKTKRPFLKTYHFEGWDNKKAHPNLDT